MRYRGVVALITITWLSLGLTSCQQPPETEEAEHGIQERLEKYTTVRLTTDTNELSESQRAVLRHLVRAAQAMEGAYWQQAYGDRDELMSKLETPEMKRFAEINYGPWDRLAGNEPFVEGVKAKPPGANFYPESMTKEELESAAKESEDLESLYTMVRRNDEGRLEAVPYSVAFEEAYGVAAAELRTAAELTEEPQLRKYLDLRARALLTDDYRESDMAWMDMKDNTLDIVIGPIETYEDGLFGYKAANEALVLVKDRVWSERLARYTSLLGDLQRALPIDDAYKRETPGLNSDLNAYDVVYYAGDSNAGSKAIAVNLPNDERVQLEKGTRRLQLKNAMRAKFDEILSPIADILVEKSQRENVRFDAFFENVMFHEVAHGLGIKTTLDGRGTVRAALKERASALEEAKADVLGLFMLRELGERGELEDDAVEDNYVTFVASIFRSVRFGAANAHGRANLMQLNFLREKEAFAYDEATGTFTIDPERMESAIEELAGIILKFQGDGDYEGLGEFIQEYQRVSPWLEGVLSRISEAGIPVDIVFEQGLDVLQL
ncbi:MAG TPA: Zn-dependent hydrolase [Vicinamibacteria bacterium]|nr:Zn-dependent hydrolase [Vicinamibacteria bacterium]